MSRNRKADDEPGRGRKWVSAVIVGAAVVGLATLPGYRDRVTASLYQIQLLPERIQTPLELFERQTKGLAYEVMAAVRGQTFEDAVLWVSNDRRDRELASVFWMAFYQYPRVLLQGEGLIDSTGRPVDFIVTTPHFNPLSDPTAVSDYGVVAVSERARRFASGTWAP